MSNISHVASVDLVGVIVGKTDHLQPGLGSDSPLCGAAHLTLVFPTVLWHHLPTQTSSLARTPLLNLLR